MHAPLQCQKKIEGDANLHHLRNRVKKQYCKPNKTVCNIYQSFCKIASQFTHISAKKMLDSFLQKLKVKSRCPERRISKRLIQKPRYISISFNIFGYGFLTNHRQTFLRFSKITNVQYLIAGRTNTTEIEGTSRPSLKYSTLIRFYQNHSIIRISFFILINKKITIQN